MVPSFGYLFPVFLKLGDFSRVHWWCCCSSTKKISHWGGSDTGDLLFPLSILLLASLGQHVARLCWFLSSCNQAKMHMSNSTLSFSLERSSLFSILLQDGKRVVAYSNSGIWCVCYKMFVLFCYLVRVLLSVSFSAQ